MDLKALVKDKKFLAVAGIGGAAGLFVLIRRSGNPGTTTSNGTDTSGASGSGSGSLGGTYDSTSADIASQLADFKGQQRDALDQFSKDQLTKTTDAIKALPLGPALPKGAQVITPNQGGLYRTNPANTSLFKLASMYHLTAPQFRLFNPKYKNFPAGSILPVGEVVRVG